MKWLSACLLFVKARNMIYKYKIYSSYLNNLLFTQNILTAYF